MIDMLTPLGPTVQMIQIPADSFYAPYWLVNVALIAIFAIGVGTGYGWKNIWRRIWEYAILVC